MIKKLLSIVALVAVCCTMSAQSMKLSKCPTKLQVNSGLMAKAPQKIAGVCKFSYCAPTSEESLMLIGVGQKTTYDACIYVPAAFAGKQIKDISFWTYDPSVMKDTKVWISTDVDNMGDASNADGGCWSLTPKELSINTLTLDNPYTVPATGCYVGYTFTITNVTTQAGVYPVIMGNSDEIDGGFIMRAGGEKQPFYNYFGEGFSNLTISTNLDGDFADNAASIASKFPNCVSKISEQGTTSAFVLNHTAESINTLGYTVTDDKGNVSEERETSVSGGIAGANFGKVEFLIDGSATPGLLQRTITLTKVNGKAITNTTGLVSEGTVECHENTYPRTILIEKFTGQACGFCPKGERQILASIDGLEDWEKARIARIDHHAGYNPDIFTLSESKSVVSYFGITGAPQCMIDRRNVTGSVVFNPITDLESASLRDAIASPTFMDVNLQAYLEPGTRNLTVVVSGNAKEYSGSDVYLTTVVCQSGYEASQANATNWKHNDFPIKYLCSNWKGDILTPDADGKYEVSFNLTLPEKYKVAVDLTQLTAVAFASRYNSADDAEVYNAASMKIAENDPAGIDNVEGSVGNGTIIGRYTVDGQKVNAPVKGINILKTSDGRTLKVLVK